MFRSTLRLWQSGLIGFGCVLLVAAALLMGGIVPSRAAGLPLLAVSPAGLVGNTACTYTADTSWSCSVTLSRADNLQQNLKWSTHSSVPVPGLVLSPSSGVLPPGGTQVVAITVPFMPCPNDATIYFKGPGNVVKLPWKCFPTTFTVTPDVLNASNCPAVSGGWSCTTTLAEPSDMEGGVAWTTTSSQPGVTFSPSKGNISPGQSTPVTIFVPDSVCSNTTQASLNFWQARGGEERAVWKCGVHLGRRGA